MKKILMSLTLFLLATIVSFADEQKKVKLDDGHTKEQVNLGYCNVFVTRTEIDDDGNAKVLVEIENLDESNLILLFGHAYPENDLKKLSPSITFDKIFPGTKGQRNIDTYRDIKHEIFIEPSEKKMLPDIIVKDAETKSCRIPLYIAKYQGKKNNKVLLLEKQILQLEIEVEVKPDEDFLRLQKESNDLIEEIAKQTFCTNSKHRPSLENQKAAYKKRIDKIKTEINDIISRHKWFAIDPGYQKYNSIKQNLDAIDFSKYEADCGKHQKVTKQKQTQPSGCKYCSLTPQQIYHKLDDYYKKIYSSNNRKETKKSLMSDVNLLYSCPKHSPVWKQSEYKTKITERYNRINNL